MCSPDMFVSLIMYFPIIRADTQVCPYNTAIS